MKAVMKRWFLVKRPANTVEKVIERPAHEPRPWERAFGGEVTHDEKGAWYRYEDGDFDVLDEGELIEEGITHE